MDYEAEGVPERDSASEAGLQLSFPISRCEYHPPSGLVGPGSPRGQHSPQLKEILLPDNHLRGLRAITMQKVSYLYHRTPKH